MKSFSPRVEGALLSLCIGVSAQAFYGCGDDSSPNSEPKETVKDETPEEGKQPEEKGIEGDVFALTTQVFGETEDQSYVLLTKSLDDASTLDLKDAVIEIPGRALGTGLDSSGALFIASDLEPKITRYELTDDGTLAEKKSLSFLGKGLTGFSEYGSQFQYVSDKKAYWFDGATAQIVVWDPSSMQLIGDVQLPDLVQEEDANVSFTAMPVRRGDKLYTFAAWRVGLEVISRAAVVVVDTKTDSVKVVLDDRCGYVRDGAFGPDGRLYLATEAFGTAAAFLDETSPEPCMLRFDSQTEAFDQDFEVKLSTLTGGKPAGSLIQGPNNQVFLRILEESKIPETVKIAPVLSSVPVWAWATLTLGDTPSLSLLPDAGLGGGRILPLALGSQVYSPLFIAGEETLLAPLETGGPSKENAVTVPGLVFSAVKLH